MTGRTVLVRERKSGVIAGFTTVHAEIEGGPVGEYTVADRIVGTQQEIDEILAQSDVRQAIRAATKAGGE